MGYTPFISSSPPFPLGPSLPQNGESEIEDFFHGGDECHNEDFAED
jgi:hypothetical protein